MNVPSNVMALRLKRASDLRIFAGLLERVGFANLHQIYEAANNLQDKTKGIHTPNTTDYSCWGYAIENLTLHLDEFPKRHIRPASIYALQVSIDTKLLCHYETWGTLNDPLVVLNFRVKIRGLDERSTYAFGFHIDKHNSNETEEIHPIYHLQYTPIVDDNENIGSVLYLDSPRMMHVPLDLILGIDMVLSNFAPKEWNRLRDLSEYQSLFKKYQENFWKPYIHTWASYWSYNQGEIVWNNPNSICPYLD